MQYARLNTCYSLASLWVSVIDTSPIFYYFGFIGLHTSIKFRLLKKYIYWILTQIKWQLKEHSSIWYIVETFLDARTHSTATTAHKLSMHLKIEGCKLRGCWRRSYISTSGQSSSVSHFVCAVSIWK
jgi:hypothetical protein